MNWRVGITSLVKVMEMNQSDVYVFDRNRDKDRFFTFRDV